MKTMRLKLMVVAGVLTSRLMWNASTPENSIRRTFLPCAVDIRGQVQ